jgi:5-methylcytosine-specific restriction endonuclease McrA
MAKEITMKLITKLWWQSKLLRNIVFKVISPRLPVYVMTKAEMRGVLLRQQDYKCFLCGEHFRKKGEVTIDHWVPISKGGTNTFPNLRVMHQACNTKKGDIVPKGKRSRSVNRVIAKSKNLTI